MVHLGGIIPRQTSEVVSILSRLPRPWAPSDKASLARACGRSGPKGDETSVVLPSQVDGGRCAAALAGPQGPAHSAKALAHGLPALHPPRPGGRTARAAGWAAVAERKPRRAGGDFSDATNAALMRHPSRRFPGLLVQGDTLYSLRWRADLICQEIGRGSPAYKEANDLRNRLRECLSHYKAVLTAHGIALPFSEIP